MIFVALIVQFLCSVSGFYLARSTEGEVKSGQGLLKKASLLTVLSAMVFLLWKNQALPAVLFVFLGFLLRVKKFRSVFLAGLTVSGFVAGVEAGVVVAVLVCAFKILQSASFKDFHDLVISELVYVNASIFLLFLFENFSRVSLLGFALTGLLLGGLA